MNPLDWIFPLVKNSIALILIKIDFISNFSTTEIALVLGLGTCPNIGIGSRRCRSIGCLFFPIPFAIGTDQGSRAKKRVGSGISALGSGITTPGIGISGVFHWIKDQAFWINKILRDKGSKFSSRLEPGIKNLGKITGSGTKKYTSLRPCYLAVFDLTERTFLSGRGGVHVHPRCVRA